MTRITSSDDLAQLTNSNTSDFDPNDQDKHIIEYGNAQMTMENEESEPATPEEIMDILRNISNRGDRGDALKITRAPQLTLKTSYNH